MKMSGVLNKDISEVVASMGHGDMLVVSDAGLAIPRDVRRIDLAVKAGVPGLLETLETIVGELKVESVVVPEDMDTRCPQILQGVMRALPGVRVEKVHVATYKELVGRALAVVRTGECTAYANGILVSGVIF